MAGFNCFSLLVVLHLSLTVQDQAEDETQSGQCEVRGQTSSTGLRHLFSNHCHHFFFIQFLSKWTYIHTPGIHTNVKLIYADFSMVYQKQQNTALQTKQTEQKTKKSKDKTIIYKQNYKHTFTTSTATTTTKRKKKKK